MPQRSTPGALSGAASWLAIVSPAFFWAWVDQCMFGPLTTGVTVEGASQTATLGMLAGSLAGIVVMYAIMVRRGSDVWHTAAAGAACAVGAAACAVAAGAVAAAAPVAFVVACCACGAAIGALLVPWGVIAICEGPRKALLHLSGAWTLGLLLDLPVAPFQGQAVGWATVALYPALSFAGYCLLKARQGRGPYKLAPASASGAAGAASRPRRRILGVDALFVATVVALCALFGFMTLVAPGQDATWATGGYDALLARGVVSALVFGAGLLLPERRLSAVFRVALSLVALGAITLTLSMFVAGLLEPGRVLVAAGYAGFDLLVWVVTARLAREDALPPAAPVAVAMAAEQAGILVGSAACLASPLAALDDTVAGGALVAANYLLLLACYLLVRAYADPAPAAPAAPAGLAQTAAAVDELARTCRLTARETDVLRLLAEGRNVPYIAEKFVVSENTVKSHVRHIYEKCGFHDRQEMLDALEALR